MDFCRRIPVYDHECDIIYVRLVRAVRVTYRYANLTLSNLLIPFSLRTLYSNLELFTCAPFAVLLCQGPCRCHPGKGQVRGVLGASTVYLLIT